MRLRLATGEIVLVLAIVVAALRFVGLSELPMGLNRDEGIDGALALQVLRGEHAIFFLWTRAVSRRRSMRWPFRRFCSDGLCWRCICPLA